MKKLAATCFIVTLVLQFSTSASFAERADDSEVLDPFPQKSRTRLQLSIEQTSLAAICLLQEDLWHFTSVQETDVLSKGRLAHVFFCSCGT